MALLPASTGWTFEILPVSQEVQLAVGNAAEVGYVFHNDAEKKRNIEISVVEWRSYAWNREKGIKIEQWFPAENLRCLEIEPGEKKKVTFKVNVPRTARGELAGMIYFSDTDPSQQYKIKFGVSLYIRVSGTVETDVGLSEVGGSREPDKAVQGENLKFWVKVLNRGNVHLRPTISASVESREGVFEIPFKYGTPVFPGEQVVFPGEVAPGKRLPPGEYKMTVRLKEPGLRKDFVQTGVLRVTKDAMRFSNQGIRDGR
ncbi:MAG: hypothetical protein HGA76_09660 [Candidatus Firestonebacteria bacterium]|nr:hypothetical protein [Candidatus Firestonebacteria bacterium]